MHRLRCEVRTSNEARLPGRALLSCVVLLLCAGSAAPAEMPVAAPRPAEQQSASREPGEKTIEELAATAGKSVVIITFAGRDGKAQGLGSGFIIAPDGLIATNLHVIGDARPIAVQTADGRRYDVKAIHATDRAMDLAIVRIDARNLPPLELGDSDALRQGEQVIALGNPRGLKHSVVAGVVSGRREIDGRPMIQLAIPIEQGNSGGPVLDLQGRVHGIVTLKSLVTRNLGFAVAISALRPLLEKPNPVPISRWLTIGRLDPGEWSTLFGARWRQRAGHLHVAGRGDGFGGRSIALRQEKPPELPFETAVTARLEDEGGAAGLVFYADGDDKHYGFYPSNGKLRLSRFDGPDVFSWQVLKEVRSPHYRPGDWNTLKVRLEKDRIQCFVNDEPVIESRDSQYVEGQVGLAKFRETAAEFKGFKVAGSIPPSRPSPQAVERIAKLVADIPTDRPPQPELVEQLLPQSRESAIVLRERARRLEEQAQRLRQLATAVNEHKSRTELVELMSGEESDIDLLRAALLVARIDNAEVDVDAYVRQVDRMAAEVAHSVPKDADEGAKLAALDKYLFEEMGFHGSRTEYYHRSNSYINEVIDDREGLPITLSVLYIELARRLGVKVVGVGLPGHFVVRHEPDRGESQLIDAFDRGKRLTRQEAVEKVKAITGRPFDEQYLVTQGRKEIIARMLANLMNLAREANDAEAMLRYVETLVALEPQSGQQRWFRAVLRFQTDRIDGAIEDTEWVLENQPAEVDLRRVRELRRILENARTED